MAPHKGREFPIMDNGLVPSVHISSLINLTCCIFYSLFSMETVSSGELSSDVVQWQPWMAAVVMDGSRGDGK